MLNQQLTTRMRNVQSPVIPIIGEWIAQHPDTISLGQGIVHYAAPVAVRQAVIRAVECDGTIDRYASVRGIDPFVERIEQKVTAENGIDMAANRVVVTPGSNMGFVNAILAIADVGDEIVLLSPFYFNHDMAINLAGCRAVHVSTDADYQIDLEALQKAITSRTKAIVTVSPNNPTGTVYSRRSLTAVNQLAQARGVYHISDEAYEYFNYSREPHFSAASLPDASRHTISLYTLSKAYGMAGWRVGYMVVPKHLEASVKKIQDTNLVCPPLLNQIAAAAAMEQGWQWCREKVSPFSKVRDLVLERLQTLGDCCSVPKPDGAFYVLAKLDTRRKDMELVEQLVKQFGVAVLPGTTFGTSLESGCAIRIAFGALQADTIAQGMGRLVTGLTKLL